METIDPAAVIASGFIVIFLTEQARRWVSTDFLPMIAVGIGIVTQLVNDLLLAGVPITGKIVWFAIVAGFVIGASAAGARDLVGTAKTKIPPAEITVDQSWLPGEVVGGIGGANPEIFLGPNEGR